jgi:ribosome-binding protein aMBF1 (putative translation factor)
MECYDCGNEITGEGILVQRSSTHRDVEVEVCMYCAIAAGDIDEEDLDDRLENERVDFEIKRRKENL